MKKGIPALRFSVGFWVITMAFVLYACGGGGTDSPTSSPGPGSSNTSLTAVAGEEVLFTADSFGDLSSVSRPLYSKYEWIISDDTTGARDASTSVVVPVVEGRAITHVFINPGTYRVTLRVTEGVLTSSGSSSEEWDDVYDFPSADTLTFTKDIVVTGSLPDLPPLVSATPQVALAFENSLADLSGNSRVVEWGDGTGSFVQGIRGKAIDVSGGKYIKIKNPAAWLGGAGEFTVSFWAKKKDMTKATNVLMSMTGASGAVINYHTYNNPSALTNCRYSFQMRTAAGLQSTNLSTRDGYENTLWHHYAFTYSASEGVSRLYLDGRQVATRTYTGTLGAPTSDLMIGYDATSGNTGAFNGYIDELKIYGRALTERELAIGFEVWHADFHARSAQYLYVQIPEKGAENALNRLKVTVSGGALTSPLELVNKTGLHDEEIVLLNNAGLSGSANDYVLTVQLFDPSNNLIYQASEKFRKTYSGAPVVAIDENNSLRVNGQLFFPVTPWGLNNGYVNTWADSGYINSLFGQGFWGNGKAAVYTIDGYQEYLDLGVAKNIRTIGPGTHWSGQGTQTRYFFQKSSDPVSLQAYVEALGAHEGNLMWAWWDEPELNGISAQVMRAWTYISHRYDAQHPVLINYMGHPYSYVNSSTSWWGNERRKYTYGYSKGVYGMRKPNADMVSIDYYPINAISETATDTMHRLTTVLDTLRLENFDLLPIMSCVETTDPGAGGSTPWAPSVAQLRMLNWLNVVHEVKAILWFHYFGTTPAANYAEMTNFTRQITELTPAVLGPRLSRTVTVDYNGQTGRIDTMLRKYNGKLYLIAVRVSEVLPQASTVTTPPLPAQDYTLTNVTLNLGSGLTNQNATVYEEGRTVAVTTGQITDNFAPYAVHIYQIVE